MGDLPQEVQQFLELDRADESYAAIMEALLVKMRQGKPGVMDLVLGLGEQLVSEVDPERLRATMLLAQVLEEIPEMVQPQQLGALAGFFGERLGDWRCIRPAMAGCLALARRGLPGEGEKWENLAAVEDPAVAALAASFMTEVHVPSLQALDRLEALKLLRALLTGQGRAAELLRADVDLAEAVISSIDGEKDPRCLLAAFECVCALALLFPPDGTSPLPLPTDDQWEELHSVIACYFPVSFHPPRNMENPVTRKDIVKGLQAAMTCHPRFAECTVPLLLEKATSPSKRDLEDSMAGLVACCAAWGEEVMRPHAEKIWSTLEIHLTGEDEDDASQAADCLRRCSRALCPSPFEAASLGLLPGLALEAQCWTSWMTDLQELAATPGAAPSSTVIEKAAAGTDNAVRAFAAVAGVSVKACHAALNATLPILIDTATEQRYVQGMNPTPAASAACRGIALTAIKPMISAAHELMAHLHASASTGDVNEAEAPLAMYCDDLVRVATHFDEAEDNMLDMDPPISTMRLQVLGVLCNAPPFGRPLLSPSHREALLVRLLDVVQSAPAPLPQPPSSASTAAKKSSSATDSGGGSIDDDDDEDPPALACAILRRSAASLSGCPAYGSALPRLLSALDPQGPGDEDEDEPMRSVAEKEEEGATGWAGTWPLQALMAISEADAAFRRDAIGGLGGLVAEKMGRVVAAAAASGEGAEAGGKGEEQEAGLAACMAALEEQHRQQGAGGPGGGGALLAREMMAAAEGCCSDACVPSVALERVSAAPWLRSCSRVAAAAMLRAAAEEQAEDTSRAVDKLLHHTALFAEEATAGAPSSSSSAWLAVAAPVALAVVQSATPSAAASALSGRAEAVLEALRRLCVRSSASGSPTPQTRSMAAITLASIINKSPQQQPGPSSALLDRLQEDAQAEEPSRGLADLLGWVARSLAMAGRAEEAARMLGLLSRILTTTSSSSSSSSSSGAPEPDGSHGAWELLDEASRAYGHVLGGTDPSSSSSSSPSSSSSSRAGGARAQQLDLEAWGRRVLSRQFHCTARILWEQRTLVAQMAALQEALKGQQGGDQSPLNREALQLSVLWLITAAPTAPLQKEMSTALPLLLDALENVTTCRLPGVVEVLPASIRIVEELLPTDAWGPWLSKRAEALVRALVKLCGYKDAAAVRAAALRCLTLVVESVEYPKLHPLAKTVRREIDRCLDDPKRFVRLQAAKTKHKWSARG